MDYEKKYKEAIERLKQWDREHPDGYAISDRDEFIFPELKEIEGGKVRKWLINLLRTMQFHQCDEDAGMPNKALSWIEKQGDQKPAEWSEQDEYNKRQVCRIIREAGCSQKLQDKINRWLESFKPQSTWKPSDEQMEVLIWCKPLFADPKSKGILESLINDLKKLREE